VKGRTARVSLAQAAAMDGFERLTGQAGMVLPRLVRAAFGLSSGHPLAGE
jgi:hypothetical protein